MAVVEAVEPVIYANEKTGISFDSIVGAVIAGVIVGLAKSAFLNKFPTYVEVAIGVALLIMYGQYSIIRGVGFVLTADGIYSLIKSYIPSTS
ncbi:hypothetical protein [Acidianus bottle-shaped virus 2 strain ABV2]|uniref:Uncharacterized protein n=1 Tax=Acidianus bottle-shaped virus 2 strain ABV2 TaxID=1732173 RepID=A0A0N9PAX6_9VIRU|nr:hypothetical protein AVU01_gp37 [Acidianus bottle-shaped virus 2 strain ABV2]ALG96785.1 hypothetical protein [Acidianus bottle-shaped virus 2 strain ABV2]